MYTINGKIFFLAHILFLVAGVGVIDLDKYIFPWYTFIGGGCLRLESLAFG